MSTWRIAIAEMVVCLFGFVLGIKKCETEVPRSFSAAVKLEVEQWD